MFRSTYGLVLLLIAGCAKAAPQVPTSATALTQHSNSRSGDSDLVVALLQGDDAEANRIAAAVLSGDREIMEAEIRDDRAVAPAILLRVVYQDRPYQLGVATVSDFVICLLQMRHQTSTLTVIREFDSKATKMCSESQPCDVCNSHAYPVDSSVRGKLQDYWAARLKSANPA